MFRQQFARDLASQSARDEQAPSAERRSQLDDDQLLRLQALDRERQARHRDRLSEEQTLAQRQINSSRRQAARTHLPTDKHHENNARVRATRNAGGNTGRQRRSGQRQARHASGAATPTPVAVCSLSEFNETVVSRHSIPAPRIVCEHCDALKWKGEFSNAYCLNGKVFLAPFSDPQQKSKDCSSSEASSSMSAATTVSSPSLRLAQTLIGTWRALATVCTRFAFKVRSAIASGHYCQVDQGQRSRRSTSSTATWTNKRMFGALS